MMEEYRFATLRALKTINRHSIDKGFNRTIKWSKYCKQMRRVNAHYRSPRRDAINYFIWPPISGQT